MIKLLQWTIRIGFLGAFVLGAGYWFGRGLAPLNVHMALGSLVAVTLAILALWALASRVRVPAAVVGLLWAAAVVFVGTRPGLLAGSRGIEVIHPVLGIGAIGLGEMLAAAVKRKRA